MGIAIVIIFFLLFLIGAVSIAVDIIFNKECTKKNILQPQFTNTENEEQLKETSLEDAIDSFETMSSESFNFLDQSND